jgi:predicted nucleic acid-binding protein
VDLRLEVPLNDQVAARGRELQAHGLRPLDALHVASAEAAGCAYLVTTDDRMAATLRRNATTLRVRLADPMLMVRILEGVEP